MVGSPRQFWIRVFSSLLISGLGLLLLSWYLERADHRAQASSPSLPEAWLPELLSLEPLPGANSGVPLRDHSVVELIQLVARPPSSSIEGLACVLDLQREGLYLRQPEQVPQRIHLRAPPLAEWSPRDRNLLLRALERLLEAWDRDPSQLALPSGEDFRTLALWMRRDPIPWARR